MIIITPPHFKRKIAQNKRAAEMKKANDRLIESLKRNVGKPKTRPVLVDQRFIEQRNVAPVSNTITGSVFAKRDLRTDHKWRKDSAESKETIAAIERKANSVAPIYNKGPLQLVVDKTPEEIASERRR